MTSRQIQIQRALLELLAGVPSEYLLPETALRSDTARAVTPPAHRSELDEAITQADRARRITGVTTDTGTKWKISDMGRAWLQENP